MRQSCIALLGLLFAACVSTYDPPPEMLPPPSNRQAELTTLYDQLGHRDESIGTTAARECASGTDRDRRFLSSLWGGRAKVPLGARRLGSALSAKNLHAEALEWFERAYFATEDDHATLAAIRYEMAVEYLALGRREDAINLLANRLDAMPLSADMQKKYDDLIDRASRG